MPEIAEREAKEASVWRFCFSDGPRTVGLRFRCCQGRVGPRESASLGGTPLRRWNARVLSVAALGWF